MKERSRWRREGIKIESVENRWNLIRTAHNETFVPLNGNQACSR